ncbi:MAG: arginine repressor [Clostridiales bacterium]|jgi:transcriptional regulator of arginine metabolism|nr:arginine repressor [Clostridiales bacterium]
MKVRRQSTILKLIGQYDIGTQQELTEHLNKLGFNTTQATVSRDIKELRLVKTMVNGRIKYTAAAADRTESGFLGRLRNIFKEGVLSFDSAMNIVVIKTMPGLASAACSALDNMHIAEIVGTIAGDDTGFLVLRDIESAESFCQKLQRMLD